MKMTILIIQNNLGILGTQIEKEKTKAIPKSWLYYKYDLMQSLLNIVIIYVDLIKKLNDTWITYDK